ncbi:MAG: hypothetical protein IJA60_05455 [Clostridia bacterium]|nr:hypothetical protein [Clostridia bacterium]
MKNNKLFLCLLLTIALLTVTASADMGPKPSVNVTLDGTDEICYGTLLSTTDSYGPHSAWNGEADEAQHAENKVQPYYSLDYNVWNAFVKYEDADGYYFLQQAWILDEENSFTWKYLPPDPFKILLYFPESDTYYSSEVLERYAFDSYYTVRVGNGALSVKKSYNYAAEFFTLAIRILLTISIEIGIALLFFKREKANTLKFIAKVNITTQILLNLVLNLISFKGGLLAFLFCYFILEIAVWLTETMLYLKYEKHAPKNKLVLYAFIANAASFIAGYCFALIMPEVF